MNRFANFGHAVLTAQRDRDPDGTALTFAGRDRFSYAELDARVNRRAHALIAAGLAPGERVATLLDSPLAVVEVYLAQAKSGMVLMALNPYWDPDVLAAVVTRGGASAFVYGARFDELVAQLRPRLPEIRRWIRVGGPGTDAVDLDDLTALATEAPPQIACGGDELLALYFTSGSTGLPKAVAHTHSSALATAERLWLDVPLGRGAVVGTGPIIWGIGFVAVAAPALAGGARLALEESFGPDAFLESVPRERITHISVTPSFFSELLSTDAHASADLSSLRVALLGGEPLLPAMQQRIRQRFPQLALYGYFGQTEAPYSAIARRDLVPENVVGWARSGTAVRVVDQDGRRVVGQSGEIQISGPHVMTGYDGQPEATGGALRDGWFIGGDLGILDEQGRLSVLGRKTDAVLRGGRFIAPLPIEDAATGIEDVSEAVVIGLPAEASEQTMLLVVSPKLGTSLDPDKVSGALADRLPADDLPDLVVIADSMPHADDGSGGRGKLLRREVRQRWGHLVEQAPEQRSRI
ncbi:acyl--CoA ligase [Nocardia sp. CA2R105]|uniref:class I adenylate-forming enzyme family protein n=1 Tax=Nocardia coffeae TaxID=2873381 RepID=UPI001CA62BE2|nr:class I adenylate-forming enzyme family protein [Nocardia coffeae]MBY8856851.1 acyl--CoA ligase [Nocardia coffeae]